MVCFTTCYLWYPITLARTHQTETQAVSDDSAASMTNHNQNIYDPTAQPNTINHAISDCIAGSETEKGKKTYSSNSHSSQRNGERKGDT